MVKHLISRAGELFSGNGRYAPLTQSNEGRTGAPMMPATKMNLGAADTADPNGIVETQNLTALGVFSVDVTATAAIAAAALLGVFDVPRNVVAAWTGTAILTVVGVDEYGETMSESSASGTSMTGKKAFKEITDVSTSADITVLTVGTGTVLGLPYALAGEYDVLAFYADTTEEKLAATFAAQDAAVASVTTGDIRGTVDPNTAPDGSVNFYLWAAVAGTDSKEGLVGVTQA